MTISREAFESLQHFPVGLAAPGNTPLVLAQTASWAVWASRVGVGDTSWSRDTSILTYEHLGPLIHVDAVFIALNDGGAERAAALPAWHMFHSGRRDYMLAEAVEGTWLWGAYMTDFFKGMPTSTASDLKAHLKGLGSVERRRVERAMADQVRNELDILGGTDPLLIAVGASAHEVVVEHLGQRYRTTRLTHYSARQLRKDTYRAEVEDLIARHPRTPALTRVGVTS